jgi:hypothetical protein
VENSEATWKKATKCNKIPFLYCILTTCYLEKEPCQSSVVFGEKFVKCWHLAEIKEEKRYGK